MNRLLILLFGTVSTAAVLVLLLLLYRYANEESVRPSGPAFDTKSLATDRSPVAPERRWLEKLAVRKRPAFAYPVTEMAIDLPLKKRPVPKRSYRLLLSDLDAYKLFCIRQLLKKEGVDFAMFHQKKRGVLVISGLKRQKVDKIIRLVKEYHVDIRTENYIVKD